MKNRTVSRLVAFGMAAVMVAGASMTVLAEANITGAGSSTGHVNKKVINVVWPTVASSETPFNFTMDAEGLIKAAGNKLSGSAVTLPASDDTGVYFLTAASTYANESTKLNVISKSSVDVTIKATAKAVKPSSATDDDTLITLADSADFDGTDPALYLGIVVGSDEKAVTTDGATASATVAGKADNFEVVSATDGTFSYAVKSSITDDSSWNKTTISLKGAVNSVTDVGSVIAPTVEVTWSYEDPSAAPTYTEETANGSWSSGTLWLSKDGTDGFDGDSVTVEISEDGTAYTSTSAFTYDNNKWVSIKWADMQTALDSTSLSGIRIRIVDGTTRYSYSEDF